MTQSVLAENVESWKYKGEGNASLVITHCKDHHILKLCKCSADSGTDKDSDNSESDLREQVQYVRIIMKPLLGAYVCLPELVPVTQEFIQSVNERFHKLRPQKRHNKMADPRCRLALRLPDLSYLHPPEAECDKPTFCVEIKPKMGFITTSPWIHPERAVKKTVCRYCLLQRLKVKRGDCSEVNTYCPVDLFSGNKHRMKHALLSLLKNPQNNLRIFKDGKCLYASQGGTKPTADEHWTLYENLKEYFGAGDINEDKKTDDALQGLVIDSFLDIVIKVLLHQKEELSDSTEDRHPTQQCKASFYGNTESAEHDQERLSHQLPHGCVLDRVLKTQMLDNLDIEGILTLYEKFTQAMEGEITEREKFQLDWPFDEKEFLQKLTSSTSDPITPDTLDTVSMATIVHKLRCFLVAGTAKDCSILVTVQPLSSNDRLHHRHPHLSSDGNTYIHSCHVIDLDNKPSGRILKYHKMDTEIVDNYLSMQT